MNIKDTNGLLKTKSADAQVSELLEELDINATEDKDPKELESTIDTKDVYEGDEETAEDVGSVEIKEEAEATDSSDDAKDLEAEDPNVAKAKEENDGDDKIEPADSKVDDEKKDGDKEDDKKDDEDKKSDSDKDEEKDEPKDDEPVSDNLEESSLFDLLRTINESIGQLANGPDGDAGELKNEATDEGKEDELESNIDTEDVYGDDEEKSDDVGSVEIKEELEIDATEDKEPEELEPETDTEDVYGDDEEAAEDVGSVEITEELEPVATEDKEPEELEPETDTEDVYGDDEEKADDVGSVEIKEELEIDATEDKEPTELESGIDTKDVYEGDEEAAEDVGSVEIKESLTRNIVNIVVEAAKSCKEKGIPATITNICEAAESELASMMGTGDKPADKEYDVDAAIESSEMNGNDKEFKDYKDIQGDGADAALTGDTPASAVQESVKYTSLKEACMLDEDYFTTDSYIKETADEKVQKLTEQIALLMAREAMDPAYDELLKESIYCTRLQESIKAKYIEEACKRANKICKKC